MKIRRYKKELPDIDPLPKLKSIIKQAPNMSDRVFHQRMSIIFTSLRDGHLSYSYPGKQSCFTFDTGLIFARVMTSRKRSQVIVKKVEFPNATKADIQAGDILLTFDGLTPPKIAENFKWALGASTPSGVRSEALFFMSFRLGTHHEPPKQDYFQIEVLQARSKSKKRYTLPWMVSRDKNCLKESDRIIQALKAGKPIKNLPKDEKDKKKENKRKEKSTNNKTWKKIKGHGILFYWTYCKQTIDDVAN